MPDTSKHADETISSSNVRSLPTRQAELPLRMAGGPLTCTRCQSPSMYPTWHVYQDGVVCPDCARKDPELCIWQNLCGIYDQIDDLMVSVNTSEQRKILGALIEQEAPHFALWRDNNEQGDQP